MADNTAAKIFGGSPLGVLGRLILVSILVGVVLSALGLDPFDIFRSVERLILARPEDGREKIRLQLAQHHVGVGHG